MLPLQLGFYILDRLAYVRDTAELDGNQIVSLEAGTRVEILETKLVDERWRARIAEPAGWISLKMADNSLTWAHVDSVYYLPTHSKAGIPILLPLGGNWWQADESKLVDNK